MPRLLTDSGDQERHFSLKRWERGAQRAAWTKRASEHAALPLPCPWRASAQDPVIHHFAHVLALFAGDLAVVRFLNAPAQATAPSSLGDGAPGLDSAGLRVLRGPLPWDRWCPMILAAWKNGAPVPEPFRLRQRLPPQWLEQALAASPSDQAAFLATLRAGGFLQPLRPVTPEAVAPWLRWDEMRGRLMDVREKSEIGNQKSEI